MTSARWNPKDMECVAGREPIQIDMMLNRNPEKSEKRCAASVIIAMLLAR